MRWVLIQCHKINLKSASFATKLSRDETRLDTTEHNVLKPRSWTCGVDFGTSAEGVVSATVA